MDLAVELQTNLFKVSIKKLGCAQNTKTKDNRQMQLRGWSIITLL